MYTTLLVLLIIDSIVLTLVARRSVSFMAKSAYFTGRGVKGRFQRAFFSGVGAVPVERGAGSAAQDALDAGLRVLEAGGSSLANVVKVTIFLRDMTSFPKVVELRGRWFTPPYPADTIVEVSSLALPELLIEIEAIAVADAAAER